MRKRRVLFLISSLAATGPVNVMYGLIKHLDQAAYEVTVLSFKSGGKRDRTKDFLRLGVTCQCLEWNQLQFVLLGKKMLETKIRQIHPDVIHAQCFRSAILLSRMSCSNDCLRVATMHCVPLEEFGSTYGSILGKWMTSKYLAALKKLDCVVACSKTVGSRMHDVTTHVVQNGIVTDTVAKVQDKIEVRKELHLPLDARIFISVGTLTKRKNPALLLQGFLEKKEPKDLLIFCGEGAECKSFRESGVAGKERVIFTGNVTNVKDYLDAADVYLSAAKSEGLPMAVLEALRSGLPLLLSDIPQHREILEDNLSIGITFQPENLQDFEKGFVRMQQNWERFRRDAIREFFMKHFTAERMAKQYQDIYEQID